MNDSSKSLSEQFFPYLRKITRQLDDQMILDRDAALYVETLLTHFIQQMLQQPMSTQAELEERMRRLYSPLAHWALNHVMFMMTAQNRKKIGQQISVNKMAHLLTQVASFKLDHWMVLFMVSSLEFIIPDILKFAVNYAHQRGFSNISKNLVQTIICADKALSALKPEEAFDSVLETGCLISSEGETYSTVLRELQNCVSIYLHELNIIVKVIRPQFTTAGAGVTKEDVDIIFCNIVDVQELTQSFYDSLLGILVLSREHTSSILSFGETVLSLAEAMEFNAYLTYSQDPLTRKLNPNKLHTIRDKVQTILSDPRFIDHMKDKGVALLDFIRYPLARILLLPFCHMRDLFQFIEMLQRLSPDEECRAILQEAWSVLLPVRSLVEELCTCMNKKKKDAFDKLLSCRTQNSLTAERQKINEIQTDIDCWEGPVLARCCTIFYKSSTVTMQSSNGKSREVVLFLFDTLLLICRQIGRLSSPSQGGPLFRFHLRADFKKIRSFQTDPSTSFPHSFGFEVEEDLYIISCSSKEEKVEWVSLLVFLLYHSDLDRLLEQPDLGPGYHLFPSEYIFAEDESDNVVYEDHKESSSMDSIIKGATLIKLVARLTVHKDADMNFQKNFLTTFRSFCSPSDLIDLLICRYNIPKPQTLLENPERGVTVEQEVVFQRDYVHPVQLRVLNVIRHWVVQHFYDFEQHVELEEKLTNFLATVVAKNQLGLVESISKHFNKKRSLGRTEVQISTHPCPPVQWHLTEDPALFDILTLHPLEVGRQLTLIHSKIFRQICPSELVGLSWTKKDKDQRAPNVLNLIQFSNIVAFWMERIILEASNLEERVAIMDRLLDILKVFQKLNDFCGIMEIVAALNSSAIHRLQFTFAEISTKKMQLLSASTEFGDGHFKKYFDQIHSIDPPCVPFLGVYLTNILKIEEGNPDFLPDHPNFINFSKRRKVAEVISELQQFQCQLYALQEVPSIKNFFLNLDPLEGLTEKEFHDYLFQKSLEIEPRGVKHISKTPRTSDVSLRSPGIRPSGQRPSRLRDSFASSSMFSVNSTTQSAYDDGSAPSLQQVPQHRPLARSSVGSSSPDSRSPSEKMTFVFHTNVSSTPIATHSEQQTSVDELSSVASRPLLDPSQGLLPVMEEEEDRVEPFFSIRAVNPPSSPTGVPPRPPKLVLGIQSMILSEHRYKGTSPPPTPPPCSLKPPESLELNAKIKSLSQRPSSCVDRAEADTQDGPPPPPPPRVSFPDRPPSASPSRSSSDSPSRPILPPTYRNDSSAHENTMSKQPARDTSPPPRPPKPPVL